jgi:hypothetical protein
MGFIISYLFRGFSSSPMNESRQFCYFFQPFNPAGYVWHPDEGEVYKLLMVSQELSIAAFAGVRYVAMPVKPV